MIITCYHKKYSKNACFVVIFLFVMENSLFAIIYKAKFFPSGAFHGQGWIFTPPKFIGSQ